MIDTNTQTNIAMLKKLGFEERYLQCSEEELSFARITEVNRGNYKISNGLEEVIAELSGKFLFTINTTLDYPTVGDWVLAQFFEGSLAIIHTLLPRKSLLKRLDAGKAVEFQLIASNIDYAFIVQSVNANFDINRLERYLVMVNESDITPIILLTKRDLISKEELVEIENHLSRFREKYQCISLSSLSGEGIETVHNMLISGKTYSLLGSSGVGKTTLLNRLLGAELYDVKEIREKDDKGKHTTSRRQLVSLESGAIFIDTPGMRELGNFGIEAGMEETFDIIHHYASLCKFKNCTHTSEKGCAILQAVNNGEISEEQFHNFAKMQREAQFYDMSSQNRKQKDKKLAKQRKHYLKGLRKK